ncbi:type II secretion system F family protein [Vibrio agarivorans]|uniref:type II secretion system F family protein n=1 Tax=Vibrio agarivorans TaxID=153622 RepID=UPI0025B4EB4F|nr:type II secretion system F family protein [Vibrio agarivorans]MDN3661085.1 type II secretion system F family protein [Vibrio agarivorans]
MITRTRFYSIYEDKLAYLRSNTTETIKNDFVAFIARKMLKKEEVIEYIKFILELVGAGANLTQVVDALDETIVESYPKSYQKILLKVFYKNVRDRFKQSKNADIFDALKPYLNDKEQMIFKAAPTPLEGLKVIYDSSQQDGKLRKTIIGAAVMPFVYFLIIIGLVNGTQEPIIGKFTALLDKLGANAGYSMQTVDTFNRFIIETQVFMLPFVIFLVALYAYLIPNLSGAPRNLIEKVFLIGLPFKMSRDINAGLFLTSLALLYRNGINTKKALGIIEKSSTPFMKHHINQMLEVHSHTGSDRKAIQNDLFPTDINHMLSIFFRVADPTKHMEEISKNIIEKIETKVRAISIAINTTGSVALALYLVGLVLAMMELQGAVNS